MTNILNGSKDPRVINLKRRCFDVKFDLEGTPFIAIDNIGAGAYGVVCSAINKATNERVAIKKTSHIFDAISTAKRTYREIKILRHFSHTNIIAINSIIVPRLKDFTELYVVFDLMESDLHKILSSKQPLSIEHTQYFLYQLLCGLKYIHSAGVTHRDLKPSNLLVNSNCQLKIGDFGMARSLPTAAATADAVAAAQQQLRQHPSPAATATASYLAAPTIYVATRWYRAPELLLGHSSYTSSVDLWSTGCILAEMLNRTPLFPGADCIKQLALIVSKLGQPPAELLAASCSDVIRGMVAGMAGAEGGVPLAVLFPGAPRKAIDLMGKLLCYLPHRRLTAEQALGHLFLNRFRNPLAEPSCPAVFDPAALEPPSETRDGLRAALLALARDCEAPLLSPPTPPTPVIPPTVAESADGDASPAAAAAAATSRPKPQPQRGGGGGGGAAPPHYVNRSKYFRNCEGPRITVSEHTKDMLKRALLGNRDAAAGADGPGGAGASGRRRAGASGRMTAAQRKLEREARQQRAEQRRRRVGQLAPGTAAAATAAGPTGGARSPDAASTAPLGISTAVPGASLSTEDQRCLEKWRRLTPPQPPPPLRLLMGGGGSLADCLVGGGGSAPTPLGPPPLLPVAPVPSRIDLDEDDDPDAAAAALSADFMQMLGLEEVVSASASAGASTSSGAAAAAATPAPLRTPRGTGLGYGISLSELDAELDLFSQAGLEQPTSAEAMRDFLDVCAGLDLRLG